VPRRDPCHVIEIDTPLPRPASPGFVAASPAMRELLRHLERAAELDANVLVLGPSGSGKSAAARLLHELGPRARGPFVPISCASTPPEHIEAILFGDRGRPARGGTLLLDDVDQLPLSLQPRLVRMLQERVLFRAGDVPRLDVRIVATSGIDLAARVREGQFREELYFRLKVLTVRVPALADRTEDVREIAERVVARHGAHFRLTAEALRRLERHRWPGNVRELVNVLEHAASFSEHGVIDSSNLEIEDVTSSHGRRPRLAGYTMEDIERWALLDTLEEVGGNKAAAARALGVCEKTIYNKLKRLRLANRQMG